MDDPPGRTILVINGRVLELPPARSMVPRDPAAGPKALLVLGALFGTLGVVVAVSLGPYAAIGGVLLFLLAGVLAGAERYELATAVGVGGLVWTSVGIALYLGSDPALATTALLLATVGVVLAAIGVAGAARQVPVVSRAG